MHIVFLHGFLGSVNEYLKVASFLPYQTELLSLPNHGCSDANVDFSNVNSWLEEQLITLKVKECVLYGYSLGGRIALNYALNQERPKIKIRGLIIESANIGLVDKEQKNLRLKNDKEWAQKFSSQDMQATLQEWYEQPLFANLSQEDKEFLVRSKKSLSGKKMAECLVNLSLAKMPFMGEKLKQSNLPIKYLYGEKDEKFSLVASKIKNYNNEKIVIKQIPNAGHNCHFSNSAAVISEITDFMKKLNQ